MMHDDENTTVADVLKAWDAGESIWTVERGGLGPGYEQAIQVLFVEMLRDLTGKPLPDPKSPEASTWGDDTVHRLNHFGFSGAQVGMARDLAWRVIRDGYHVTLESAKRQLGNDCLILVGKNFPAVAA